MRLLSTAPSQIVRSCVRHTNALQLPPMTTQKKRAPKPPREPKPAAEALRGVLLGFLQEHIATEAESINGFGRRAGISNTAIGDVVSGRRESMGLELALSIAEGLGFDLGDVQMAAKQWARGIRPASACFGKDSLAFASKLAGTYAAKLAIEKAAAEQAASPQ